jgi:transcriptional regulator with XRE-family HTH domain
MHTRQAAAFAAVERTGLTKSDIAKIAGTHRSQVSRWASGEQRPSYERTMRLAAHLRPRHPELAEELVAATGYGPVEADPESAIPPEVRRVIERAPRDDQWKRDAIEALEAIGRGGRGEAASSAERHAG